MGMSGVAVGVGAAVAGVVKAGASYEKQMSKVKALTGASTGEMKQLDAQAKHLGSTTKFSASEAADGMAFLGMAGYKTKDIMAAMPGLLDLAAAGAMDLGSAADITSNIMSGFGLSADKTGHAADVLALAASNANTDVGQLGEAMKYLAPTAKSVGWSMEESTAAVMAMSDAGIQGSMAGQAFGSSLTRLADPTTKMRKVMDELNLSFFDSEGKMKPLPQLVGEIQDKTKHLTQEQKAARLSTLFGAEAYKHWAVLLEAGGEKLGKNTEMLKHADGAAKQMADTMSDNLVGSWDNFLSKLEGVAIAIFTRIAPALRWLVDGMAGILEWTLKLLDGSSNMTKGIGTHLEGLGKAITTVYNVIAHHFRAMVKIFEDNSEAIMKIWKFLWDTLGPVAIKTIEILASVIDTALTAFRNLVRLVMALITGDWQEAWESFKDLTMELIEGLGDLMSILWEGSVTQKLVQKIVQGTKDIWSGLVSWYDTICKWFSDMIAAIGEWIAPWWNPIKEWLVKTLFEWTIGLRDWWNAISEWFTTTKEDFVNWLSGWWSAIVDWFSVSTEEWKTRLGDWHQAIAEWWDKLPEDTLKWLENISKALEEWNKKQIDQLVEDFKKWWEVIDNWFTETKEKWSEKLETWSENIQKWWEEMPDKIYSWFTGWWDKISTWYDETKGKIGEKLEEWGKSIQTWWESIPNNISNWFKNWWNAIGQWYDDTKKNISDKLRGWGETIQTWFTEMPSKFKSWFKNWWKEMSDWFTQTKEDIKNWLKGWLETIKNWFKSAPDESGAKNSGAKMIKEMVKGSVSEEPHFTEKLGKMILKVIGLVLLAVVVAFVSAGKELIKYIIKGIGEAAQWIQNKLKEVFTAGLNKVKEIDWIGLGKDIIQKAIKGLSSMGKALQSAFTSLFKGIHIPVPKFSVNGSLNPVNWVDQGLPSVNVRWAKNGALIKPGMPTLVGVGDAPNYDEVVLPLKDDTLGRIGREIMQTMPTSGVQQVSSQPIELVVNLDSKVIARETYQDVEANIQRDKETRKLF
ncbi:phage tail tape measure protein [Bacillus paranthracis]